MANVTVSTTRPVLGDNLSLPIFTDHLIIRSYRLSDLEPYHALLSQPEAMGNNMSLDLNYTKQLLDEELPPHEYDLTLGIFLKKSDRSEGDLIGEGGVHHLRTKGEWPELSYRFKKEYWNKGYATEFAIAFMRFWWNLPREATVIEVRPKTVLQQDTPRVSQQDIPKVAELVYASVKKNNEASEKVLKKAGFEFFDADMGDDGVTHWRNIFSLPPDPRIAGEEV